MTAELAAIREPAGRRRFAAGCIRAVLAPPGPQLGSSGHPSSGRALTAISGMVAVIACIGATGYFLARYPTAALHLSPGYAVLLAATLAGFGWLTLRPPRLLAEDRFASGTAVVAALTIAAGLLLTSRLGLRGVAGLDVGVLPYLYLVPITIVFAGSAWAARRRSFRAGVQTAVWTVLLASLLTFAVALPEAVRWYDSDTSLILASDAVPLNAVGENLRNFTWSLLLLPCWWLPFGIIGGRLAARETR